MNDWRECPKIVDAVSLLDQLLLELLDRKTEPTSTQSCLPLGEFGCFGDRNIGRFATIRVLGKGLWTAEMVGLFERRGPYAIDALKSNVICTGGGGRFRDLLNTQAYRGMR